jgi:heptosyltransferase-2
MKLKTDCYNFVSDRPCKYQKNDTKLICSTGCRQYVPVKTRILIIKLAALGDVLRTTSILNLLCRKYRQPAVYWVTDENAVPLLENVPGIKEVLPFNTATLARLIVQKFDVVINLDLTYDALSLAMVVNTKARFGFGLDKNSNPGCFSKPAEQWFCLSHDDNNKKKNNKTCQQYYLAIAGITGTKSVADYEIQVKLSPAEHAFADMFAHQHKITAKDVVIGLNTGGGATWEKKEWTVEHTSKLVNMLCEKNRYAKIMLYGGKKEKERNNKILNGVYLDYKKRVIDTGTGNSLRQFIALLSLAQVLVTSDTLALHIALGLKKKVVALFGPTSSDEIEIYGRGKKIVAPINCTVCYKRECDKMPDCMELITPESVFNAVQKLI